VKGAGRPPGQLRVALTGGIGSGKSTVAALLAEHGAVVVEADQVAREVVAPGTPGAAAVIGRFGPSVVAADGTLDRPALARLVFADPAARADLDAIVHPLVVERSASLMADAGPGAVVVYDVPLLVETGRQDEFDLVITVTAPLETRMARLAERGLRQDQAAARIDAQANDADRAAVAWAVVDNSGSVDHLSRQVSRLWLRILAERAKV
jgi:dephospho-CoA kinase